MNICGVSLFTLMAFCFSRSSIIFISSSFVLKYIALSFNISLWNGTSYAIIGLSNCSCSNNEGFVPPTVYGCIYALHSDLSVYIVSGSYIPPVNIILLSPSLSLNRCLTYGSRGFIGPTITSLLSVFVF